MSDRLNRMMREMLEKLQPKGNLDHTAKLFLACVSVKHKSTGAHLKRVALLSAETARALGRDEKAAFFGGLLHDFGKMLLPYHLFNDREITQDEYVEIKKHARMGFEALKNLHLFTALCAGIHHGLYENGYGLTVKDFPPHWPPALVKKVLGISTIISICDFIDAHSTRRTKIKDGSSGVDLKGMLLGKYPDDQMVVEAALMAKKSLRLKEVKRNGKKVT